MAKKRKIKAGRVAVLLMAIVILLVSILGGMIYLFELVSQKDKVLQACQVPMDTYQTLDIPLNSENYVIARVDDEERILYAKDLNERIYPASLTKIMTMMVTLDHTQNINEMLTVKDEDLEGLIEANASVFGLASGDEISVIDALYGLILESGADCANLLKRYVSDQGYDFIELMNEKAADLMMKDSHFSSVSGLHEDDNYTTVYDLMLLMREALKNDNARTILETMTYSDDGYEFYSTLSSYEDIFTTADYKVLGGKTGFTYEAHLCIAAVVAKDGDTYLVILANADENGEDGRSAHLEDVLDILETYFVR